MRAPWKRAAVITLATCGFTLFPLVGGCKTEVEKANDLVSTSFDKTTDDLAKPNADSAQTAVAAMQKTAGVKGASPETQVEANALLAQAELNAADQIVSGPDGIAQRQIEISRLLGDIDTLVTQINSNNLNVAGYGALEPAVARKAIEQVTTSARKGENGAWVPGAAPVPSLEAVTRREQDLQKQIADLTQQESDQTAQRAQALTQAAKFSQQADATTGKESTGFFIQAANQRKEAADAETRIREINAKRTPLQQDLALAQIQQKAIESALTQLGDQTQKLEEGWKTVQQHIDEATGLSKSLLDGSGVAGAAPEATPAAPTTQPQPARNLVAMATELSDKIKAVQNLRAKAVELLDSAFKHYDTALQLATKLSADLSRQSTSAQLAKLPEKTAWQTLSAIEQPSAFKLREAAVQTRLAQIHADELAELMQRSRTANWASAALKGSGLNIPQAVSAILPASADAGDGDAAIKKVEADLKAESPAFADDATALAQLASSTGSAAAQRPVAAAQAELAYKWSASLLNEVLQSPGQGEMSKLVTNIAHAALMADYFGWAQLDLLQNKAEASTTHMKSAVTERQAVVEDNALYLLPAVLPAGLQPEVSGTAAGLQSPATSPALTTQPSGGPTSAPSTGGTFEGAIQPASPAPGAGENPAPTQPATPTTPATPEPAPGAAPAAQ